MKALILLVSLWSGIAAAQVQDSVLDLSGEFQGLEGAFVLLDRPHETRFVFRPDLCATRFTPASTFKILNSLIGLETGVIPDKDYVIRWDSVQRDYPEWNRDHTLQSAIRYSVVWYYQELASRVGAQRMQDYLSRVGYGNDDIAGGIDRFWLGSSLKISPFEQVDFLKRLCDGALPFSSRSVQIVQEILPAEERNGIILYGKTGFARQERDSTFLWVGWYVGYVQRGSRTWPYATLLLGSDKDQDQIIKSRIAITKAILRKLHMF